MKLNTAPPQELAAILQATRAKGFDMASEPELGSLLRTLAATKPGGNILELGTGTGLSTAWLLDGMDEAARLISVENEPSVQKIARRHLEQDRRCRFVEQDGREFLLGWESPGFDLVFADAWPGKFFELDRALELVNPGGLYVIDDLRPLPSWPESHAAKVEQLRDELSTRRDFVLTELDWSTGILIAAKRQAA